MHRCLIRKIKWIRLLRRFHWVMISSRWQPLNWTISDVKRLGTRQLCSFTRLAKITPLNKFFCMPTREESSGVLKDTEVRFFPSSMENQTSKSSPRPSDSTQTIKEWTCKSKVLNILWISRIRRKTLRAFLICANLFRLNKISCWSQTSTRTSKFTSSKIKLNSKKNLNKTISS